MVGVDGWRHGCSLWRCITTSLLLSPILDLDFSLSSWSIPAPQPACAQALALQEQWREKSAVTWIVPHRQHCCHCCRSSRPFPWKAVRRWRLWAHSQRAWRWSTQLPSSREVRQQHSKSIISARKIWLAGVFGFLMNSSNFLQKADTFLWKKYSQKIRFSL